MRLALGAPRHVLVVAPHPDDEVVGAFGLIARLRRAGARVRVLVVTDGAASHPNSRRWPRARLVRQRRRESRWAMARLGIHAGDVRFLGLPDGGLHACEAAAAEAIATAVGRERPDLLVGPLSDDDHPDHRVVARALARCRLPGARRLGYPVWPRPHAPRVRMLPILGGALAKRWALALYRTQGGLIGDDPEGFALTRAQVAMFARASEPFVELGR